MIPLESFAPDAQKLFCDTSQLLHEFQHHAVEPEHLLWIMLEKHAGNVIGTLNRMGVDTAALRQDMIEWVQRQPRAFSKKTENRDASQLYFTGRAKAIVERAIASKNPCVDTIFTEICREKLPILLQHGVTIERLNYAPVPDASFSEQEQRRLDFQRWLWQKQRCEFSVGLYPLQGVEQ